MEDEKLVSKRVVFEPYQPQQEYIDAVFSGNYSFLTYGGAMGGGKSFVGIACIILLCRAYPGSRWCIIRESIPTLKNTTLVTFKKVLPSNFLVSFNQQDHIANFKNGSQILFMAEDFKNDKDFDRFKGLEVNGFLLEQIEELQEDLLSVCFIRAGRHKILPIPGFPEPDQPDPLILANMNPTLLWPKARIYDPWMKGKLPADWYYKPAKIMDNPILFQDEKYMSKLDHLDDLTRRRLIEGDWTAFGIDKPYLYKFSIGHHVIDSYEPNLHLPILISFDFNKEPMTAIAAQTTDLMTTVIFDEFQIGSGSTEEMCEEIRAKYKDWQHNLQVTGDATGHNRTALVRGNLNHYRIIKDQFNLPDRDLLVPKQNPEHKDSRVLVNSVLQHAKFLITNNCEKTIADCVYTSVDETGKPVKSEMEGRHFFDNYRYICHAVYPDFIRSPKKYRK